MHPSHGHDQTIVNGISRIGYMKGGKAAHWNDEEMADVFTREALEFLEAHQGERFFLMFSAHDPHVPRVPHPRFAGCSGMGPRGDAIVQFDANVGTILDALERLKLSQKTLVVLTSDNGPVVDDGYKDDAVEKLGRHRPSGPWRGGKYSNFEAGTRVPLVVRWPGRIEPGESEALVAQVDLTASFAALTDQTLADADAPDSVNVLSALLGKSQSGRDHLVEQGGVLSLRRGPWKYIEPGQGPSVNRSTQTELGNNPAGQLYNLAEDPGETTNLLDQKPDIAGELRSRLQALRDSGRTRP
jgi:arylsulfatase A-like enzyme